ncbi:hypothetical protein HNP11_004151 [Tsukamurella ocularis]|uniref:hypothetical protein n=1 Tax=Tsukamurella ocularis TaxID=1970234 RepID=UPI002168865B|nr:hypothetical protein [Tsukamurella ocularis]MCS3789953.1 hypothetical protein [Tsukamurella ocularis]
MPTRSPQETATAASTVLLAPSAAAAARTAAAGQDAGSAVRGSRRSPTEVGSWVIQQGLRAIESGGRLAMPAPPNETVEWFIDWGTYLNGQVHKLWIDPGADADFLAAVRGVGNAADALAAVVPAVAPAQAREPRSALVWMRADARVIELCKATAAERGLSLGAFLRDAVDATLGRHWDRPPADSTRDARRAAGRIAGLLVQADTLAQSDEEVAAVDAAGDQLAALQDSLAALGTGRR